MHGIGWVLYRLAHLVAHPSLLGLLLLLFSIALLARRVMR